MSDRELAAGDSAQATVTSIAPAASAVSLSLDSSPGPDPEVPPQLDEPEEEENEQQQQEAVEEEEQEAVEQEEVEEEEQKEVKQEREQEQQESKEMQELKEEDVKKKEIEQEQTPEQEQTSEQEQKPEQELKTEQEVVNGPDEAQYSLKNDDRETTAPATRSSVGGSNAKSTIALVRETLKVISEDKDIKKYPNVQKVSERTLAKLQELSAQGGSGPYLLDSIAIFEALRSCCRTKSTRIQLKALDCISKLFSFRALDEAILVNPPDSMASNDQTQEDATTGITPPPKQRLIDASIDTISDCFQGEGTDERIELQIVSALSSCILTEDSYSLCHGASLLKAVRTIYNIFIFSLSSSNQGIAQATLTQIVGTVFDKIDLKQLPAYSSVDSQEVDDNESAVQHPPLTLQNMDVLNEDEDQAMEDTSKMAQTGELDEQTLQELLIKDAFLVFRAMSKISAKPLETELDMRSHAVRSKLLSLHIIYSIIKDHIEIFLCRTAYLPGKERVTLLDSMRQYLCLSLSRNAASSIAPVFEVTLEIMWLIISNLRAEFKREIPVFLTEIYFPISDLKTSTLHQKRYFLSIIQRLCNDPRTLIEFYLNYDCNQGMPNIMEMMVDYLTRLALTRVEITPTQRSHYMEQLSKPLATYNVNQVPLLSTSNLSSSFDSNQPNLQFPVEFALKMTSLNCIVSVLRSLSSWAHRALNPTVHNNGNNQTGRPVSGISAGPRRKDSSFHGSSISLNSMGGEEDESMLSQEVDDPSQFESLKQQKTELTACIKLFNSKPKRAIPELITKKFLRDDSPKSIAEWLLATDGLDLATVGDYLGEGEEKNIEIMHAFVDEFDFTGLSIVDALRNFLQKFRLPGEGQKIDRFMLKFAERFTDQNPGIFSKADTAYVLSYSIIMLNTDLHSSQIKSKMSLQEFLENNSGIDNGKDLPQEFMVNLYNEIANNEIKLLSEQHQAMLTDDGNLIHQQQQQQSAFNFFSSRDLVREAYMQVSKEMSSKTELVFKNLNKSRGKGNTDVFYAASHVEHVKSVFETLWMSFLAALTPPFKDYDDVDTTNKCLEGLKISIKISATFGIEYARKSFIGALVQFCNLQNLEEIKIKNVNAIIVLLDVASSEGTFFKESWKDVLLVISQVERLQLISKGIDRESVPDVAQARVATQRVSFDSTRSNSASFFDKWTKRATPLELAQEKHYNQALSPEISKFISSSELVVLMDHIFTRSSNLSGNAIVDFIKALTDVSLEEIESSQDASTPRMFSLQKMVDVCYYNMDRIKVEWTPIWAVMGTAFNKIATNPNLAVVFFAVDSLRQLSMRFLNLDELSGFEFQHDFLKPFEYIIQNTSSTDVQEMIIECFRNFILTKSSKIKSGWKPILESLQYTAKSSREGIIYKTYVLATNDIVANHFESVFCQEDAFSELVSVFKEITKNKKSQKLSLHALEGLRKMTQKIAEICFYKGSDESKRTHYEAVLRGKDVFQNIWFPMLFCFNDTIMTADDLEVRSRALNYMFDALVAYGNEFDDDFWEKICTKLLFPIFGVLSKHWEVNQFNSHDDLTVWLSTTLIQALRNLIALFTHYFKSLNKLLDGFLGLLVSCICQENDTIARIGRSCLQQLILQNVAKFNDAHWQDIGGVFDRLFELTTATELFEYDPMHQGRRKSVSHHHRRVSSQGNIIKDDSTNGNGKEENNGNIGETVQRAHEEESSEDVGNDMVAEGSEIAHAKQTNTPQLGKQNVATNNESKPSKRLVHTKSSEEMRHRISVKNSIVVKCVLHLLMIELLSELFENEEFASCIPHKQAIKVTVLLEKSYEFARDFNEDYQLRTRLVEARVVDKIPNLLKQETSAAAVLINILFKLYLNDDQKKRDLGKRLIDICTSVVEGYVALDDRTMERSINSWRPVIVEILQGYYEFDDDDFKEYCPAMYGLVMLMLDKSVPADLRKAVKVFLSRVGELYLDVHP
ncbi:probable protein transport protein SEC7 [Zygosaccharomyces bailii ISA1307]|nr:probable protein transport protein SEC7 [Zygosaccharomyces bailii ISA1307]